MRSFKDFIKNIVDNLSTLGAILSCVIAFFVINFAIVKYANHYLEKKVDNIANEVDTIKNNHIVHLNEDIRELKEGQKEIRKEIIDLKSDISHIKGMLEILVKDKK
jgi:large-conductance mechanosensitive channel